MLQPLRKFILSFALLLTLLGSSQAGRASTVNNVWTSSGGPGGGGIAALVIDPAAPSTLYAGTTYGVYKTTDGGDHWASANAGMTGGAVHVLAINPLAPATLYLGTVSGRLFKSTDAAVTWNEIDASGNQDDVRALLIDPKTPATLYFATQDGVSKSTDGGASWNAKNAGLTDVNVRALAINPLDPDVLYAGTGATEAIRYGGGVFKTTDGGESWNAINAGLESSYGLGTDVYTLAIDPLDPAVLYAGTGGGADKTTDGGDTWTGANLGIDAADYGSIYYMAIDPATLATLYAARDFFSDYDLGEFKDTYRSIDGGKTWNWFSLRSITAMAFDASGPGAAYAATDSGVYKSTDGGVTWSERSAGLPGVQVLSLAVDPTTPGTLYAGAGKTTPNVYKSTDGGESWAPTGANFDYQGAIIPIFSLAIDSQTPSTLYAGSESYTLVYAGPPYIGPSIYRSTNGGANWGEFGQGIFGVSPFDVLDLVIDPADPLTLYAATNGGWIWDDKGLYKSTNGGNNWNRLATGQSFWAVSSLVIDPQHTTTLYAALSGADDYNGTRGVIKSTDGGDTWRMVYTDPPLHPSYPILAIDPRRTDTLYLALNSGVYKTTDGGESWQPATSGLPAVKVSAMVIDPQVTTTIYLGTNAGVYKSIDGGESWRALNAGLTNTTVHALAIDPAAPGTLYAATDAGVFTIRQAPPALAISDADGAPGSAFVLTGSNFPPGQTVPFAINGSALGPAQADSSGNLSFTVQTGPTAGEGLYLVTAPGYPGVAARFTLDAGQPLRLPEGSGTDFDLLDGIAYSIFTYFPMMGK